MQGHIDKAKHNEEFLHLIDNVSFNDFDDWRITVIFYAGLHYMRAFLMYKKVKSGHSHKEIDFAINPKKTGIYKFPVEIYECYKWIYEHSRHSRYSKHISNAFHLLLMKARTEQSKKSLSDLKSYFKSEGLKI